MLAGFLLSLLGRRMLTSCEVAVEYYLACIHSPQVWVNTTVCAYPALPANMVFKDT
jgi:hypothetical protein